MAFLGCERNHETVYPVSGNVYEPCVQVYEQCTFYYFLNDSILFFGDGPDHLIDRWDSYKWIDTLYYIQSSNDLYIYRLNDKTKLFHLGKSHEGFITFGGAVYNLTNRDHRLYNWP